MKDIDNQASIGAIAGGAGPGRREVRGPPSAYLHNRVRRPPLVKNNQWKSESGGRRITPQRKPIGGLCGIVHL